MSKAAFFIPSQPLTYIKKVIGRFFTSLLLAIHPQFLQWVQGRLWCLHPFNSPQTLLQKSQETSLSLGFLKFRVKLRSALLMD